MTKQDMHEISERVSRLPLYDQLELIERLIRNLRKANVDRDAIEVAMDAMVADPGMQRVLRNEDLVTTNATR